MPRPVRTKVTPAASSARVVAAEASASTTTTVPPSHDSSDDSAGLITTKRRNILALDDEENGDPTLMMTGGLGEGDVRGAHRALRTRGAGKERAAPTIARVAQITKTVKGVKEAEAQKASKEPKQMQARTRPVRVFQKATQKASATEALDALRKRRDDALKAQARLANVEVVPSTAPEETPLKPNALPAQIQSAPRNAPTPETQSPTELSTLSSAAKRTVERMARKSSSPQAGTALRALSALRAQGTPAAPAEETSVLDLANFKRRPRQGSILREVQQTPAQQSHASHEDSDLDLLNDFNPDDESTPYTKAKPRISQGMAAETLGNVQELEAPHTASSRKRKLSDREDEESDVQVPRSSPPPLELDQVPIEISSGNEEDSPLSYASSLPEMVVPEAQGETARSPPSSTMADPRSSSPAGARTLPARPTVKSPAALKQRGRPPRSARNAKETANNDNEDEDAVSPGQKRARNPKQLDTVTLQSFLPKRRRPARNVHARSEFDVPSSDGASVIDTTSLEEDEDELTIPTNRRRRKASKSKLSPIKNALGTRARSNKKSALPSPVAAAKKQAKAAQHATAAGTKAGKTLLASRTYGRRGSVGKENRDASDNSSDEDVDAADETADTSLETIRSKELEDPARKFREVDQWEMEFESVDIGGSSSSPWR
ncbi:hypothetical protein B0A49_00527 [Cryomyces minteri]|uniref:Uncharacterized protein n=1 Tax=Cryomyces minteri TaxID=331657 RepID=A0A4U0XY82_9PEZI|nr:hypothetical protein B0A49_00527 [Cryomyces minteri]